VREQAFPRIKIKFKTHTDHAQQMTASTSRVLRAGTSNLYVEFAKNSEQNPTTKIALNVLF